DPMLGNMVPLSYQWFQNNWQSFSYRYMVIYDPKDEAMLKAVIGDDWNDGMMRKNFYERTKADAYSQDTSAAWVAYGEAAYGYGLFREAVTAFERGMALGSVQGVFTLRSSYPQALRALGRQTDADAMQKRLSTAAPTQTAGRPVGVPAAGDLRIKDDFGGWSLDRPTTWFDRPQGMHGSEVRNYAFAPNDFPPPPGGVGLSLRLDVVRGGEEQL